MRITNLAIRYRTAVVVLTLLCMVGGLFAYITLPKESNPSIEFPNIIVTTVYPGASPDDVESLVTKIIEREIDNINGVDEIRSTSTEGVSTVVVEFSPRVPMDRAYQDVRDRVDIAKVDMPDDIEEPAINEIDVSELPIMTVNLAADYSLARLKEVAEDVQDELEGIASILEVDLVGGLTREVQVDVDLTALQGYNLTFQDITQAIDRENTNIPGGSIDVDRLGYSVRVDGTFTHVDEIRDIVIRAPEGRPIYVRDVADVTFGFMDRDSYSRLQVFQHDQDEYAITQAAAARGEMLQVVSLNVKKRSGDNIVTAARDVQRTLEAFPFPSGTQVTITGDQSEMVEALVTDLENNIISGLIFVIAVLLFFLGVRNATLVGIAIPLSMFISFIVFSAMGQTLNFIILFSLIIALGMLVDNAIVIVENIYRFREQGYSRLEAARVGTAEVGGAVVGATATTVLAFAPMLFWPGIVGRFMSFLPMTLIITLLSSLFVALVINPVITAIFVQVENPGEEEPRRQLRRSARYVLAGAIVLTALVLLMANWRTFVVLAVAIPILYLLHTRLFKPIGDRFIRTGLPALVRRYREFLGWMLERDYSHPRALLRNTAVLISLTVGFILLIIGGLASAYLTTGAGAVLIVPGGLLFGFGLIGTLFHTAESLFLGGRSTTVAGLGFALVMGLILGLQLQAGSVSVAEFGRLMALPLVIVVIGMYGWAHSRRVRAMGWVDHVVLAVSGMLVLGILFGGITLTFPGALGFEVAPFFPVQLAGFAVAAMFLGVIGWMGRRYRRQGGGPFVLTDNRARLLTGSLATLVAIIGLYAAAPTESAFFPDTDPNMIRANLEAPLGTNVQESNRIATQAQERITALLGEHQAAMDNTKNMLVNVGVGGNALFGGGGRQPERSQITLNLVDFQDRAERSPQTLSRLRSELQGIPGVDIELTRDQQGPPTGPPVNIEISGEDFDEIVRITTEVRGMLSEASRSGEIPGLVDVTDNLNTGRPELQVRVDRERAAQFGLSTSQIAQTVRAGISGQEAGQFRDGENEYDIRVRLRQADRAQLESLNNLTIPFEGQQIPLVAVAEIETGSGFGTITRLNRERVVTVEGDAAPGFTGPQVLNNVRTYLADYEQQMPPGYELRYTGESEEQQEAFGFLTTALFIGFCLILLVLIAQFNSVSAPFIIMIAVGLSLVGVLLGLIVTRTPFSLFTFIGIISLAGIVVNNNIVLVDYIMQLRQRGFDKQAAIIEGGATRLRPVLLTALTTVLGLVPLTFGINIDFVGLLTAFSPDFQLGSENTQFWGPMGTAIISGLLFATFLTLVIVPVLYSVFDSSSERLAVAFGSDPDQAGIQSDVIRGPEEGMARAPDYDPSEVDPIGGNGAPSEPISPAPDQTQNQP